MERGSLEYDLRLSRSPTMTKADLIEEVSRVVQIPRREAGGVVETILRGMVKALPRRLLLWQEHRWLAHCPS